MCAQTVPSLSACILTCVNSRSTQRRFLAIPLTALALLVTGCGGKVIRPQGAAQAITDLVSSKTGFHAHDVKCPSGVDAKVGGKFQCHFTGPDGKYTADMRITKVQGKRVEFFIRTTRTG